MPKRTIAVLLMLAAGTAVPLRAQQTTAAVVGRTVDEAEEAIGGATVTIAPGATINVANGALITVKGSLVAESAQKHAKLAGEQWIGIVVTILVIWLSAP